MMDPEALADAAEGEMGPPKPEGGDVKVAMFRKVKKALQGGDDAAGAAALADFVRECAAKEPGEPYEE